MLYDSTKDIFSHRKLHCNSCARIPFPTKLFTTSSTHYNTGKERDPETGLVYFGARYLDPKTSRWLSGDPALGEYVPIAPLGENERKHNSNLPGMGGVYNLVNLHVYHYAGNNPVKYVDPDGRTLGHDIVTKDTTKEQFDKMNDTFGDNYGGFGPEGRNDWDWNRMQEFFKENTDGAFYRAPGEMYFQSYKNKDDIKIIDPNYANVALLQAVLLVESLPRLGMSLIRGIKSKVAVVNAMRSSRIDLQWFAKGSNNIRQSMNSTAQQIINQSRKGSIKGAFPSEWLNATIAEIDEAAKGGVKTAKTAWKLLTDSRFLK